MTDQARGTCLPEDARTRERISILDVWVDPVDMAGALERAGQFLWDGTRPYSVFAVNPEKNFSVPQDPFLYESFKQADLLIPDGIGVVWAARILHGARLSRVTGVEFMEQLCGLAAKTGHGVFLYGAREEVNEKAVDILQKRYPGLNLAGRSNGYVRDDGMRDLVSRINASKASILFLALGSPMQERWFTTHRKSLEHVRICQGIGGTLDTLAGTVKRAPKIWQDFWLEWLYRLLREPVRLKRQRFLALFVLKVLIAKLTSFPSQK